MRPPFNASLRLGLLTLVTGLILSPGLRGQTLFLNGAEDLGNGWHSLPWFGTVYVDDAVSPWVYDTYLGWLYVADGVADDFWIYSPHTQSWFYTHANLYPYAYDERNGWMYFQLGGASTWYYLYDTKDWVMLTVPPLPGPYDKTVAIARFLDQTTLGVNEPTLAAAASGSIEDWMETQFNLPIVDLEPRARQFVEDFGDDIGTEQLFHAALWNNIMSGEDLLRQRVVLALSEIIVVSNVPGTLAQRPAGMANWYDMLQRHAFGNFRDLLYDVTTHPVMGFYLSHAGNRKANEALNLFPDENYAREVMQLFSIGLYELNLDGSRKVDAEGNDIPTYTNKEITEFARVFTGMIYDWRQVPDLADVEYYEGLFDNLRDWNVYIMTSPMVMVEEEHDTGEKELLNGTILPAGQSGLQDLSDAVDNLFNHPNVGPFIGRLLIQRLVKSNPSPGYISRVAAAFNDNGSGVRGDMRAVLEAIYYDHEARNLYHLNDPTQGKMREPWMRWVKLLRAFDARDHYGMYMRGDEWITNTFDQRPFASPSVFNFFLPDHSPNGAISDRGLVAPEFQIVNSQTIPGFINTMEFTLWQGWSNDEVDENPVDDEGNPLNPAQIYMWHNPWRFNGPEGLLETAADAGTLVDRLDLLLTNGTLSEASRQMIVDAIEPYGIWDEDYGIRLWLAVYYLLLSPEFTISR